LKIKSKLKINMLVSMLSVAFCMAMLANTFMRVRQANSLEKRADEIVRNVFELTMLTNDYLIHRNARAEQQWQIKHRQLSGLIEQAKADGPQQVQLFKTMFQDHEIIRTLFLKLLDINKKPEKRLNHIYKQLWNRLIGQIATTAQEIVAAAFRLSAMAKSERLFAQNQGGMIILVLMIALVAIIIINSLIFGQSLAKPIIKLQQDIKKIGHGDLDHVVHSVSNDEIGDLAAAFNGMTSNLKKLHKNIKKSNERYNSLFNDALDMIHIVDDDGIIIDANPAEMTILGYTKEEFIGKHLCDITHPDHKETTQSYFQKVLDGETIDIYETALLTKTGETVHVEVNAVPKKIGGQGIRAVLRNITERKRLERQLLHAQKMEAIGNLAGGVAHDFNNMLGVILGHTELMLTEMAPEDSNYENLEEVFKAAQRSADLTRQLLAFARKQTIEPIVLDLNGAVDGLLKMLKRLIGEDIELIWRPETDIWPVKMDPAQLDQILANLCVNARDAIPDVGRITIETENIMLDQAYCADHLGFQPGQYVMLAVSDNGCGMGKKIVDKIFEPFFTTKSLGKGSGLGLSTVYGIVKQNGGFINVYSEPGQGTSFKIFIRVHEGGFAEKISVTAMENPMGEGETILLVEDEKGLLTMGQKLLETLKYDVVTATDPDEAMALAQKNANKIRLLITDVVMPVMSGKDLAERIKTLNPNIKVLFMSGYTANFIAHHGVLDQGVHFIAKPFSIKTLSTKIRKVLDQKL
jgi:PAS domain S-box-containing protein